MTIFNGGLVPQGGGGSGSTFDPFELDTFTWTGSLPMGQAFYNLAPMLTAQLGGTAGITISNGVMKFPAKTKPTGVIFSIRISGTIGGGAGTAREWKIQTRRPNSTLVVGSASTVKVAGTDITNRDLLLASHTTGDTDPFTTQGIQLGILNESGQTITLTSASVRIYRQVNSD